MTGALVADTNRVGMLGLHWVLDLGGCGRERLTTSGVRQTLIEVPRLLGLSAVGEPRITEHESASETSVAGVVLLTESHASCHCFPASGVVHLDVFCCRSVDFEPAARFAVGHFRASSSSGQVLERGPDAMSSASLRSVVRRVR